MSLSGKCKKVKKIMIELENNLYQDKMTEDERQEYYQLLLYLENRIEQDRSFFEPKVKNNLLSDEENDLMELKNQLERLKRKQQKGNNV